MAKVGKDNDVSLKFFERQGFKRVNAQPNIFNEFVFELEAGDVPIADLNIKSAFTIDV